MIFSLFVVPETFSSARLPIIPCFELIFVGTGSFVLAVVHAGIGLFLLCVIVIPYVDRFFCIVVDIVVFLLLSRHFNFLLADGPERVSSVRLHQMSQLKFSCKKKTTEIKKNRTIRLHPQSPQLKPAFVHMVAQYSGAPLKLKDDFFPMFSTRFDPPTPVCVRLPRAPVPLCESDVPLRE